MDWDSGPGSLASIDDVQSEDAFSADTSPITAYLWGFLITLAIILALREWVRHRAHNRARVDHERVWSYVVMALLWPLFVSAILFVVLWAVLTRRGNR